MVALYSDAGVNVEFSNERAVERINGFCIVIRQSEKRANALYQSC